MSKEDFHNGSSVFWSTASHHPPCIDHRLPKFKARFDFVRKDQIRMPFRWHRLVYLWNATALTCILLCRIQSCEAFFPPSRIGTSLNVRANALPRMISSYKARRYSRQFESSPARSSLPDIPATGTTEQSSIKLDDEAMKTKETLAREFLTAFETAWTTQSSIDQFVQDFFLNEKDSIIVPPTMDSIPFWRDMLAFTWNIGTFEGSTAITEALKDVGVSKSRIVAEQWKFSNSPLPLQYHIHDVDDDCGSVGHNDVVEMLEFWCDFTVGSLGKGKAHFRLVRQRMDGNRSHANETLARGTGKFKIHTLLTTLLELSDRPFQVGANRIRGHEPGAIPNRKYWKEQLQQDEDPYVVIVGGGQAGLALGARLHLLDIPYVILEAGSQPGTSWRKRYPSLHLHDPVWYNHMPYLPFPETWPVLCPRDKIADWMEFYAKALDLNVRTDCRVVKIQKTMDDNSGTLCEIQVEEKPLGEDDSIKEQKVKTIRRTISAKHVVMATGNSSKPRIPKLIGQFSGFQLHSLQYRGGRTFTGKRVAVIGSNNSAWDIVRDMWEQGADHVTMIQRSPSMVVSTQSVLTHGLGSLYRQDAPLPHEDADLVATSIPYKLLLPRWKAVNRKMQETDKELLEELSKAGYQLEDGPDGAGIFAKSATEGGGFYIDMGCAELVIRKDVDVRYASIVRLEPEGIVIQDKVTGRDEKTFADAIVYATGFETMDKWMAQLCGEDVAAKVGRTWGLGLGKRPKDPVPWQGELRNMWKPTALDGTWFHGGNLAQSRHYSRFLALQLAARYMSIETPVYGIPEPTPAKDDDIGTG